MSAVFMTTRALLADTNVSAIVSTRVQPFPLKQGTALPAIAVAMTDEQDDLLLSGAAQYPNATVQVHCIGTTATEAIKLGEKVKGALRDLHFSDSPPVGASFVKDPLDFTDFADDLSSYRRVMGYSVRWR